MALADEIERAEADLNRLKMQAASATCAELGRHDWKSIGGMNAGCSNFCGCSVPVYECARCGACDYGCNDERQEVITECALINT
jgi:hypothetical protein